MARNRKRKLTNRQEVPRRVYDTKDPDYCVYEIYPRSKKTIYYLRGSQSKHLTKLVLNGFEGLPSGLFLYKGGYGFGKKGVFLLSALKKHLASDQILDLTITRTGGKSVKKQGKVTTVTLPINDVKNILTRLGRINEDNNIELRETTESFLSTKFPRIVKITQENFDEYQSGEIAALLRRSNVPKKLNEDDLQSLNTFFPKIFEASLRGKRGAVKAERDALIEMTKNVTDKIYLDAVIKEFESNINKKTLKEEKWQKFLKEKVFRFMSNYVATIGKQNISLTLSYPDFVLVDVYGFVDAFEIKRHDTPLLSYDSDHENYYWKPEVAQAISQIENYIDEIIHNSDDYIKVVKRKKHVDIKVLRPRGYIIAGTSKQFKSEKEREDFRRLGTSLKNTGFILYDELLQNLKNLRSKL